MTDQNAQQQPATQPAQTQQQPVKQKQPKQKRAALKPDDIPKFRHCPCCWNRRKGYGVAYSTHGNTRYYRCQRSLTDMGPCGHTWSATVSDSGVAINSREVDIRTR